jgi:hypothetical protein
MDDPHVIIALVKRRAELAGQIEATNEALRKDGNSSLENGE